MARQHSTSFEIPSEMHALADKSVAQARQAFGSIMSAAAQAAGTADKQARDMRSAAHELGGLAVRFAERNIAASFEFAQRLARAKDLDEALALQADYLKSQMAAFSEQAGELSGEAAKAARQAVPH